MPKMTLRECLTRMRDMWSWMELNPDSFKHQWPGWDDNSIPTASGGTYCLACIYSFQPELHGCSDCPMLSLWTGGAPCEGTDCLNSTVSPYRKFESGAWTKQGLEQNREVAAIIVAFCDRSLEALSKTAD